MKTLVSGVAAYVGKKGERPHRRRNLRLLGRFLLVLLGLITAYSLLFHVLMEMEGQQHSWVTGFYWTLTVMSTLGFGDITFASDVGRLFSMVVLVSGVIFLLVLLPFTLIEFFYAPWMERQTMGKIPSHVPLDWENHLIITDINPITRALTERLDDFGMHWVYLCENHEEALPLAEEGHCVLCGERGDERTFERAGIGRASLVVVTGDVVSNANTAFTLRHLADKTPIVCTATDKASSEVIRLAGASRVFLPGEMMGEALARRVVGSGAADHVIGQFDSILIAETSAKGTHLVNRTIAELELPRRVGVNLIGLWQGAGFTLATPDTHINEDSVLILSGTREQLLAFDEMCGNPTMRDAHVIIIGAGRVGQSTAAVLTRQKVDFRIIEVDREALGSLSGKGVIGDASNFDILHKAGIIEAQSVVITSNRDDINIFLTIFCRKLRPDLQIISRVSETRNCARLQQAGANIVLSYASMGATFILNFLQKRDNLMIAEGLHVFRVQTPTTIVGKSLIELALRATTGCNVVGVMSDGDLQTIVDPRRPLSAGSEMLLVGDGEAEKRFHQRFQA